MYFKLISEFRLFSVFAINRVIKLSSLKIKNPYVKRTGFIKENYSECFFYDVDYSTVPVDHRNIFSFQAERDAFGDTFDRRIISTE